MGGRAREKRGGERMYYGRLKCLLHYGICMYTKHYTMQYNLVFYMYNKKSELK